MNPYKFDRAHDAIRDADAHAMRQALQATLRMFRWFDRADQLIDPDWFTEFIADVLDAGAEEVQP